MLRLLIFILLATIPAAHAQDTQSAIATPAPEASPSPEPPPGTPAPEQVTGAATPDAAASGSGTPAPSPAASNSTAVEVTGAVVEEVVPADSGLIPSELPTVPATGTEIDGAPLITDDIIPMSEPSDPAMPDDIFVDPNAIVPDTLMPPPAAVTDIESEAEKLRTLNIRYREVRTRAESDPVVVAMKERADAARTAEDQRAALREYYRLLFKKVVALDDSLKAKANMMEDAYIRGLAQRRLEPTIPLNPPPTPEPIN